ncbi:phosphoenolpyruvate synthase/pyruvate phosphate dikinase [Rubidibacter lacunae KORDI 51-2]|uniref:Phosphoenolpyruvate synthase n=1 Tax=Rubidibacter lacunae KORDI 51-2 TaxID=582515 RepID=U5DIU2_9CHRO|nr:putative PEP-binding protein [Rubidibacter lacunae]ERN40852.1 phosphoenolpyruvate synthase/pyruvate phosphate dikinase [Rubidibacter lacunae KORDI 51-2]
MLHRLDCLDPGNTALFGSKASALAQLLQLGYPVVPGYAIAGSALPEVLAQLGQTDILLADWPDAALHFNANDTRALQQIAQQAKRSLLAAELPTAAVDAIASIELEAPAVIVRPSLVVPPPYQQQVPGLLPSRVCRNRPEAIAMACKRVWAELFSARSLFYWQRSAVELEALSLALLVQPLTNAIAAGSVTTDTQKWELRAVRGLGHALARGEAEPDFYQIRPDGTIVSRHIGTKPVTYHLAPEGELLMQSRQQSATRRACALSAACLEQLLTTIAQLADEVAAEFHLEWALAAGSATDASATEQIWLVQFDRYQPAATLLQPCRELAKMASDARAPMMRGIAAAPGTATAKIWVMPEITPAPLHAFPEGAILVARAVEPDWLPLLKRAAGAIAEQGGITSHAAILARELGIPAVVSARDATRRLRDGDVVELDGTRGEVRLPGKQSAPKPTVPQLLAAAEQNLPATHLWVSCSQIDLLAKVAAMPVTGVGLLRAEMILLDLTGERPLEAWLRDRPEELRDRLGKLVLAFARAFAPRPVHYRSLDWPPGVPGFRALSPQRGTAGYRLDARAFEVELAALAVARARGAKNVRLILPYVRSVAEFEFCRQQTIAAGLGGMPLWIMAEVPSVGVLLPEYARVGASGIAIGTSDLAQLALGIDRDDPEARWAEYRPTLLAVLQQLVGQARAANLPCAVCGPLAAEPETVEQLVHWGVTAISVEPDAIALSHKVILRAERHLLLEAARRHAT